MNRNVEPKREIEPPAELESQFILRLPPEPAKVLREVIRSGSLGLKERFSIKLESDMRYGEVRLDHWLMTTKVMDFPSVLESLKTIDGKSFYKTADVCQLLICKEEDDEEKGKDGPEDGAGEAASSKGKKKDPNKVDRKFLWPHGLTPPLKNVRKRRFRKTLKKKYVEAPEIEKEVKRLLRVDNDAVSVKWEIIANEDEVESGVGGGNLEANGTTSVTNDVVPTSVDKEDVEEPESRDGNLSGMSINGNPMARARGANGGPARFRGSRIGAADVKMEVEDGPSVEEDTEDRRKDADTSLETSNQHSMDVAEDDIFGGAVSDSEEEGIEEEKGIGLEGRRGRLAMDDDEEEEEDDDEEGGNTLLDDIEEEGVSRISAVDSRNSDSTFGMDSMRQNTQSSPLPLVTQFTKEMFSPSRGGRDDLFDKNSVGTSATTSEAMRRDLMSSPKGKSKDIKGTPSTSPAKNVSKASLALRLSALGRELEELSKQLQAAQEAEAAAPENQALRQRFARITDSLLEQQATKKQEYEDIQLLLQNP